jgi:hypothetical protein
VKIPPLINAINNPCAGTIMIRKISAARLPSETLFVYLYSGTNKVNISNNEIHRIPKFCPTGSKKGATAKSSNGRLDIIV